MHKTFLLVTILHLFPRGRQTGGQADRQTGRDEQTDASQSHYRAGTARAGGQRIPAVFSEPLTRAGRISSSREVCHFRGGEKPRSGTFVLKYPGRVERFPVTMGWRIKVERWTGGDSACGCIEWSKVVMIMAVVIPVLEKRWKK